ncbi:MAG TPA: hypothetical protein VKA08_03255 [Balneolales bacterium]|nr:hypothetical protein [Balneolales bacterium]
MNQLRQIGTELDEMIAMSRDLLTISEQAEPDLERLETGFQSRGKLLEAIQSDTKLIDWQSDLPKEEREQIMKSFENLKKVDSNLRERVASLLNHKKCVLQQAQQNEQADKRYHKRQGVGNALFIRNKLEG